MAGNLQPRNTMRAATGFTLVELMVTLAVAAILVAVALPSFQRMTANNNITNTYYDLMAALRNARSEAVSRGSPIRVKATTSTNWSDGWSVLTSDDTELRTYAARDSKYKVTTTPSGVTEVTFNSRGSLANAVCFTLLDHSGTGSKVMHITILASGSVHTSSSCS